uniref:Uncharacterized protein n=1 Tax=Arundo donax TaxID=35708 RepID=A0A0A9HFU8_ARUDO
MPSAITHVSFTTFLQNNNTGGSARGAPSVRATSAASSALAFSNSCAGEAPRLEHLAVAVAPPLTDTSSENPPARCGNLQNIG